MNQYKSRLLIPTGLFKPSKLGGPSKTLYWLAKGLVSKGFAVSVVTSNNHIEAGLIEVNKWVTIDNIRIRYCNATNKLGFKIIWHSIKELKFCNAVLLSSFFFIPSFIIALFAILKSKKVIWSPRGELFSSAINNSKTKLLYIKLIKCFCSKKVVFHATSTNERIEIKRHLGITVKTVVIPNYMELPKKQEREQVPNNYFLYVGRIAPIKALENILLGIANSKSFMSSDYKLLIVGGVEKKFEKYYKKLIEVIKNTAGLKEKVIFLGNVEGKHKFKLYANAYFSILLSHSENFGNVVIESLSQGTPVIASRGTPWKVLTEKSAGYWIDNSIESISKCFNKILEMDLDIYQESRNNAYELAKKFDIYRNIGDWLRVLTN